MNSDSSFSILDDEMIEFLDSFSVGEKESSAELNVDESSSSLSNVECEEMEMMIEDSYVQEETVIIGEDDISVLKRENKRLR